MDLPIVAGQQGDPAMNVQLCGANPTKITLRAFERRLLAGFNPPALPVSGFRSLPVYERADASRAAVRRAQRQRAAIRGALAWEV